MGEVKIYRGTVEGIRTSLLEIGKGVHSRCGKEERNFSSSDDFIPECEITDLCEAEVHEGTGVWMTKEQAEVLRSCHFRVADDERPYDIRRQEQQTKYFVVSEILAQLSPQPEAREDYKVGDIISARFNNSSKDNPRIDYERIFRNNGDGFDEACWKSSHTGLTYRLDELTDILRLTPKTGVFPKHRASDSPAEAREEQVSLGEEGFCRNEDCAIHGAFSPAKVGIELTAENWSAIQCSLRNDGNDELADKIGDYFFAEAQASLPPVELPEPKEFGAVVEAGNDLLRKYEWDNYIIDEYVNVGEGLWFNKRNRNSYEFKHLINPRVIGGEK